MLAPPDRRACVKKPTWLVVIGTSAGGLDALKRLLPQLPPDFPAALFVVQHLPADVSCDATLRALKKVATLECSRARHDEPFERGKVYLAPSD
jgi:two-component system, chemotaxis family, protein-glutamate methylesterase/glutaminase